MATEAGCKPASPAGEAETHSDRHSTGARSEPEREEERSHPCGDQADPGHGAPASVDEALARARRHGRTAAAETVAAVRALLDAASLGVSGKPSEEHKGLAKLARSLDELAASLSGASSRSTPTMVKTLLDALDHEIRRWEAQSEGDEQARAVLRAFLGLREILWEFGLRRTEAGGSEVHQRCSEPRSGPTPSDAEAAAGESSDHVGARSGRTRAADPASYSPGATTT